MSTSYHGSFCDINIQASEREQIHLMQDTFIIWKCPWQDATFLLYLFIWSELLCCISSIFNAFHMVDLYTRIPQQTSTTNPLKVILRNWQLQFASFLTHSDITSLTLFGSHFLSVDNNKWRRRTRGGTATAEDAWVENTTIQSQAISEQVLLYYLHCIGCSAAAAGKGLFLGDTKKKNREETLSKEVFLRFSLR